MEQTEELRKIVESASHGYWLPLTIVATAFSLIIVLLLYIWNQMLKQNDKRHEDHQKHNEKQDRILEEMSKSTQSLTILVTEIKTKQEIQTLKR